MGVNVGAHISHAPLRIYAMGERGATDTAPSDAELALAVNLLTAGLAALLVALDGALIRLAAHDQRQAKVVECRFFGGLTEEEIVTALNISPRTVRRDWELARAWLLRELSD